MSEQRIIDTHFHLDLFPHPEILAKQFQSNGISVIAVTNTPTVFHFTFALSKKYSSILPAIGLHPELAFERRNELETMWKWLDKTRFIGEVGLDYVTTDDENRRVQREVFQSILTTCAEYGDKIITIHSRRASQDVVSSIGNNYPGKIILHWYSGSVRDLKQSISYGFYFSVNSTMLRSKHSRELIQHIPHERILLETDGPFIKIGSTPATPMDLQKVLPSLASLWEVSVDETISKLSQNVKTILS